MEKINRKISLEDYTARFPVCYPSLTNGELYYVIPNREITDNLSNYGRIPLGISEVSIYSANTSISGYSAFTEEMGEAYSGDVLSFSVLQRWFTEMIQYRDNLYSNVCHGKFTNMVDYYSAEFTGGDIIGAEDLDARYTLHGGDAFYEWLINNYFILLDLNFEYTKNSAINEAFTYQEWFDIITEVGTSRITYPYALELLAKLSSWYELYHDKQSSCNTTDTCCDCVDYWAMGGNTMYNLLGTWVSAVNANIAKNNGVVSQLAEDLYPEFDVSVVLKGKMEDYGNFSIFPKQYNPYLTYLSGETCIYGDDVWLKTGDSDTKPPSGWTRYSDYYYSTKEHSGETISQSLIPDMSGRTISSLDSFVRKETTVDGLGNTMPGHFRPYSGSTVSAPAENSTLELPYETGMYSNVSIIEDGADVTKKTYFGDVLYSITFFCKDINGNVIVSFTSTSGDVTTKLNKCIGAILLNDENAQVEDDVLPTDGKIYADFTYYKGCVFKIDDNSIITVSGETYLKCVDHCTLEKSSCQYYLSQTESYPVNYYYVKMDEVHLSFLIDIIVNCYFHLCYVCFCSFCCQL